MDRGEELALMPTQFDAISQLIETLRDDLKTFRREMNDRLDRRDQEHDRQIRDLHSKVDTVAGRVESLEQSRREGIAAAAALAGQAQAQSALNLSRRQWIAIALPLGLAALGGPGNVLQALVMAGKFLVGGQP